MTDAPNGNGGATTVREVGIRVEHLREDIAGLRQEIRALEVKVQSADDALAGRIDRMERNWDRYSGPVIVILALLGVMATVASIASAIVVVSRVGA